MSKRCRQNRKQCSLIWVCTVCPDLCFRKLRIITVMHSRDADRMAKRIDPDRSSLIWVYTVCPTLSVQKLRIINIIMVFLCNIRLTGFTCNGSLFIVCYVYFTFINSFCGSFGSAQLSSTTCICVRINC